MAPAPSARSKRLIVYDLDGTLVDTSEDIIEAVNAMLGAMGHEPLPRATILGFVGKGLDQLIAGCAEGSDRSLITRGIQLFEDHYAQHYLDHSRLYPGVQEALEFFKARKQAVVTNKPNPFSRDILVGLGVAEYFVDLVAGEDGHPRKPDPAGLRWLMRKHGVEPRHTLFIGDSAVDVETGRNAEVETVIVQHGFANGQELLASAPEMLVKDFEELLVLARRRRWSG